MAEAGRLGTVLPDDCLLRGDLLRAFDVAEKDVAVGKLNTVPGFLGRELLVHGAVCGDAGDFSAEIVCVEPTWRGCAPSEGGDGGQEKAEK